MFLEKHAVSQFAEYKLDHLNIPTAVKEIAFVI